MVRNALLLLLLLPTVSFSQVGADSTPAPEPQLLPVGVQFEHVVAGSVDGSSERGTQEKLIYSNTLGLWTINFPSNQPVSDDIATIASDGCSLTRYRFKVIGRVLTSGYCVGGSNANQSCSLNVDCPGGTCSLPTSGTPYSVTYGLYTTCPLAAGTTNSQRDLVRIPGTEGVLSFPDDAPRLIEHVVSAQTPVALPTNVYLSLRFNRDNCGTVVGAPSMVGYSGDVWDFPGTPCNGFLGGFPQLPHASFWVEIFGEATCRGAFVGFKSPGPTTNFLPGADAWYADDIELSVNNCLLVAYESVVKGPGQHHFELRNECTGPPIEGTVRLFLMDSNTQPQVQAVRFTIDPPIQLNGKRVFVAYRIDNFLSGGIALGKGSPILGKTEASYYVGALEGADCVQASSPPVPNGVLEVSVICGGSPPMGACCDMALLECRDGQDIGERCSSNADCLGSACESVCREVPQMNCPWQFGPAWVEGGVCESSPFPHACGQAACCKPDDTCENLTQNQCDSIEPVNRVRIWQAGSFCGEDGQCCPYMACLEREGDCHSVHQGVGCDEPFCCSDVCEHDPWCCQVDWDELCVKEADLCSIFAISSIGCRPEGMPDSCHTVAGASIDCDNNGIADDCVGMIDTLSPTIPLLSEFFGNSVAIDDRWIVIGTGKPETTRPEGYALYVYERGPLGWREATTFFLPDIPTFVAMDREWIVVSTDPNGVVYFYRFDGEKWTSAGMISGPSLGGCTRYGVPVAIDGDTIAIGTGFCQIFSEYEPHIYQGTAVTVLHRDGLMWNVEARLYPPDGHRGMGGSVAISGDHVVVGAPEDVFGNAFIFHRMGTAWEHEATLTTNEYNRAFARSVALHRNMAVIGATTASAPEIPESGAVYVYRKTENSWAQEAKLTASDAESYDRFGWSVAAVDSAIVVGAWAKGSAYFFRRYEQGWVQEMELIPPFGNLGQFGNSVAMEGAEIIVGAPGSNTQNASSSGASLVFQGPYLDCNMNQVSDKCENLTFGDSTFDARITLRDFAGLQRCFFGNEGSLPACCGVFDSYPQDGDADVMDLAAFIESMLGP